jgi:hypothetical protein
MDGSRNCYIQLKRRRGNKKRGVSHIDKLNPLRVSKHFESTLKFHLPTRLPTMERSLVALM